MRVCALQHHPVYLDVSGNLDTVEAMLSSVEADLIVLPELFATGYFFHSARDVALCAEAVPQGQTTQRLIEWAGSKNAILVAGVAELEGDRVYNSAVVVDRNGLVGRYRKLHLYYEERLHFLPGDRGLPVFELECLGGAKFGLGVMICFDWYYPEVARSLALAGADVIAHPSNLVRPDCPRAMPIRALENHVFTVTANRIGTESRGSDELRFIGQSLICSPDGDVLAKLRPDETGAASAEIDPSSASDRRVTPHNDLFADRRPDAYRLG